MDVRKILLGMMTGLVFLSSCNEVERSDHPGADSLDNRPDNLLVIHPFIEGRDELARNWRDGNTLGLWVTEGNLDEPYLGEMALHSNLKYKFYSDTWFNQLDVKLTEKPAYLFACSPYQPESDPTAVAVECMSGTDYLYGTHYSNLNVDPYQEYVVAGRNKACLLMKHALGVVQVFIRRAQGVPPISVQKIELRPVSREWMQYRLPMEATLNIQSGQLTPTRFGKHTCEVQDWTLDNCFMDDRRRDLAVIPQSFESDQLELAVTIGGIEYTKVLQANHWKRGYKYIYRITFTGTDFELQDVTIKPWDTVGDIFIEIVDKVP